MKFKSKISNGLLVGLIAILINIITVVVYIYQTNIMQSQKKASVWPYIEWSTSYIQGQGFKLSLSNNGIGPALVKDINITVNGEKQENLDSLLMSLINTNQIPHIKGSLSNRVIPAGNDYNLLESNDNIWAEALYMAIKNKKFKMTIRYESIYKDQWMSTGTEVKEGWLE